MGDIYARRMSFTSRLWRSYGVDIESACSGLHMIEGGGHGRNLCTLSEPEKYSLDEKETRFESGTSTPLYKL